MAVRAAAIAALMSLAALPGFAQDAAPLKIGVLTDLSSVYSDNTGQGVALSVQMAVKDYGGKVAGRPIEVVVADHQNQLEAGKTIASRWFDTQGVSVIMDVSNTPLALAISEMTEQRDKVFITAAPTMAISNEKCSANTIQWTHDNWSVAYPTSTALVQAGAKKWFYLTVDYAFGKDLQAMSEEVVTALGGKSLGAVRHPINNQDFSSFLLQAQSTGADVIALANSGLDTGTAMKQASEFGIGRSGPTKVAALLAVVNMVDGMGLDVAQNLYVSEPFYWDMNEGTRAFAQRWFAERKKMPNFLQAGMYGATLHYLRSLDALAKEEPKNLDSGKAVVEKMKAMPSDDPIYGKGYIRADNRHVHTTYLFQVKSPAESKKPWDYYKLVRTFPGEEALRPLERSACKLVKH